MCLSHVGFQGGLRSWCDWGVCVPRQPPYTAVLKSAPRLESGNYVLWYHTIHRRMTVLIREAPALGATSCGAHCPQVGGGLGLGLLGVGAQKGAPDPECDPLPRSLYVLPPQPRTTRNADKPVSPSGTARLWDLMFSWRSPGSELIGQ